MDTIHRNNMDIQPNRLAFISSNDVWGGSEELWSLTAASLARAGHSIAVLKVRLDRTHPRMRTLGALGCSLSDLRGPRWMPRKARSAISLFWPLGLRMYRYCVRAGVRAHRSELAVISQGLNYDGWLAARECHRVGVPFVLISQKADDLYWPNDSILDDLRVLYRAARAALFVSEHNLRLTEQQLGCRLPNARVVRNPFEVGWAERSDWPDEAEGMRLACLARLDAREKGQDVLLRVLAQPKWRARPIRVRFFGAGHNALGLTDMARLLELDSVEFAGFSSRPAAIWDDHHGLVLPSRCEGLPLSLIEAMLSARLAIVTDVGGNAEVLTDGRTGFLAASPTEADLDAAMERAWSRRAEWRSIGRAASAHVRTLMPEDPAAALGDLLIDLLRAPDGPD